MFALPALVSSAAGCGSTDGEAPELGRSIQGIAEGPPQTPVSTSCGYELSSGTYSIWPGGYQAWVRLKNVSGPTATDFEVLLDVGTSTVVNGYLADFEAVEDGYSVTAPSWLKWQQIRRGSRYEFQFIGSGVYQGVTGYVISVNGIQCDMVPPAVTLDAAPELVTSEGTLSLTATASDNVAVRKVVFEQDGEVIGVDRTAPFSLDLPVDAEMNGRHLYTATAYDPTGNAMTSDPARVLVAIGNKFFGTAVDQPGDYDHLLSYFDQLTPGNAGKWGSVEAVRDQMDFARLDTAYQFARDNGLRFKLHTLVWGQQQPSWVAALPPAEQLEELEEWMQALSERYLDLEMIDVVNEPLHAPPSYADALGGAGDTGWDWVIHAFELAREYFPNSQLILNDYNVLIWPDFTNDYLTIVHLLQERGLIDGIGEQAHFLERADLPTVSNALDSLAATGLPLYVSELDVNFADDARQANRLKDLLTLFWQHPSVVGVTHWGYREGAMFQPDAYLLRGNGTERPALQWLTCYLGGGDDCTVPEYVPAPWFGDASGLTLQAELYDAAEGLLALGDTVAYTDDGDWEAFAKVNFEDDWDTFTVRYAKGNEDPGSVSLHFDAIDNPPFLTVDLPATPGWGNFETLDAPYAPVSGERDVYVVFHGGFGVANLDELRFGVPSGLGPNVVLNSDFESSTDGWFTWDGTLAITTESARTGASSLRSTNRSGEGAPVATSLTSVVTPGTTYDVSAWVSVAGAATASVKLTQKVECDGSATYAALTELTAVAEGDWVELHGLLAVPDCNLTDLLLYAEGPPAGVDLLLDHVSVRPPALVNLVPNGTFESSTSGWFSWDGTLSATSARAHGGTKSLLVSGRSGNGPAATDVTTLVTRGQNYAASFWVTIGGAAQADVNLTQKIVCDGNETYSWVASPVTVGDGDWVELSGTLSVPDCDVTQVLLYAEGPPGGVDLYVDDVSVLAPQPDNLLSDGTFESGVGGWFSWDGTLATTATRAHGGAQSLVSTDRSGSGGPIAHSLTALVTPGETYQASFWVSIGGAANASVQLTRKFQCEGEDASYAQVGDAATVADGDWVQVAGSFTVPSCTLADVLLYAEGPPAGVDLYIDDAVVSP